MEGLALTPSFWKGKRVLITGHTGFKGAWLTLWLHRLGASVTGFALPPATAPCAYDVFCLKDCVDSHFGDMRDEQAVEALVQSARPEIVFHLAGQAIFREGLRSPAATFDTNVMGLINLLEALRARRLPVVLVNVTSDKVYENAADGRPYTEADRLGGKDPYSASKACAELVTSAYRCAVLPGSELRVSSARAGNVLGGGDWAADRIVPDVVRAVCACEEVVLRYPGAERPWQHVIEPLRGYLQLAQRMETDGRRIDGAYNFGPAESSARVCVAELTEQLLAALGSSGAWRVAEDPQPGEMQQLQIDSTKARTVLGWRAELSVTQAVKWTAAWYAAWRAGDDMRAFTLRQMSEYERDVALV